MNCRSINARHNSVFLDCNPLAKEGKKIKSWETENDKNSENMFKLYGFRNTSFLFFSFFVLLCLRFTSVTDHFHIVFPKKKL